MAKKKRPDLDVHDIVPVIKEAIRRLPNGDLRLSLSRFRLRDVCLNGFPAPDIGERVGSNYGMPPSAGPFYKKVGTEYEELRTDELPEIARQLNKDVQAIAEQFYEEVQMIEKIMEEMDIPRSPELLGIGRRDYAMQIWDCCAIPWRFLKETVYTIWSPGDLMGTPIIHGYPAPGFLCGLTGILTDRYEKAWRQARYLKCWRTFGVLALAVIGLLAWAIIVTSSA